MQRSSLRPNLPKIEFSWWCGTLSCTITILISKLTTLQKIEAPCYVIHTIPSFETRKDACGTNIERDDRIFYHLCGKNATKLDENHWAYVDRHGEVCSISIVPA